MTDKRHSGRPRLRFDEATLERLPEIGTFGAFARILGIPYSTLHSWLGAGLPAEIYNDPNSEMRSLVLKKEKFLGWLRETGRDLN